MRSVDLESAATSRCKDGDAPYHYVCWEYNDRRCAILGCERVDAEEADREVLREYGGMWGSSPTRIVVYVLCGILSLMFLFGAIRTCREARRKVHRQWRDSQSSMRDYTPAKKARNSSSSLSQFKFRRSDAEK